MTWLLLFLLVLPLFVLAISPLFKTQIRHAGGVYLLHSSKPDRLDYGAVAPEHLRLFLDMAVEQGMSFVAAAEADLDGGKLAITFDDGYDCFLTIWSQLKERDIPVTIFIPTYFIGKTNDWDSFLSSSNKRHLSADQIRFLASEGVRFGSHGHRHADLTLLTERELTEELSLSRKILEELTDSPVTCLAYPYGKFNERVLRAAMAAGYTAGYASSPTSGGQMTRGRIPLSRLDNSLSFRAKLREDNLSGAEYLKSLIASSFSHLTPAANYLRWKRHTPITSD